MFGWLAQALSGAPKPVLVAVAVVSLGFAFALPKLEANPSPRALLSSADPEQERIGEELRGRFGSSDQVAVVLVSAPDVLTQPVLDYAHRLALTLRKLKGVERVDGLTLLPWPREPEAADEPSLDDLDQPTSELTPEMLAAASDLVIAAPDVFPQGLASLSALGSRPVEPLAAGPRVEARDVARIRAAAGQAKYLERRLISADHRNLLIAVSLAVDDREHAALSGAVSGLEAALSGLRPPPAVKVALAGLPVLRKSLVDSMRRDQAVLIPGTLLASLLVLLFSFRWAPAVALPVTVVALTAVWLLGGMALFGERLNVINNILPALVIIIGLNEAVHMISRYVEEYARLGDRRAALTQMVESMGPACLMTTLTSAIGMASLLVARTEMLRRFGIVGALGLLVAYLITLLIVPTALSLLAAPPSATEREHKRSVLEHLVLRVSMAAVRKPWPYIVVMGALAGLSSYASQFLIVDSTLLDQFEKGHPMRASTELLESDFEGVRPLELVFSGADAGTFHDAALLGQLAELAAFARNQEGVIRVSDPAEALSLAWAGLSGRAPSVADVLRSSEQVSAIARLVQAREGRLLSPVLTADGRSARVRVRLYDFGAKRTGQLVERLRLHAKKIVSSRPGLSFVFDGDAYVSASGLSAVVSDLSGSVTVAAGFIFLVMFVLLRDLRLAVLAIPSNLIPQLWTLSWMAVRGIPLNASSAIIFSLSVGLAVDGSVHLLSRFKEEAARHIPSSVALARALGGTGRSIVVSSLALMLGFSVMFLSDFVPVRRFAELIAVSMLGCLVATLFLQPALLELFGSRRR